MKNNNQIEQLVAEDSGTPEQLQNANSMVQTAPGSDAERYEKLKNSYDSLLREFTQKSQKLAELKRAQNGGVTTNKTDITSSDCGRPMSVPTGSEDEVILDETTPCNETVMAENSTPQQPQQPEQIIEKTYTEAEILACPEIRERIVKDYLLQAKTGGIIPPTLIGTGGKSVNTLPPQPKTIAEANELARQLFRKN